MDIKTCYKLLGVEEGAPLFYVRKAYQELSAQLQADLESDNDQKRYAAENRLKQIHDAYRKVILSGKSSEKAGGAPRDPTVQKTPAAASHKPASAPAPKPRSPKAAPSHPKPHRREVTKSPSRWPLILTAVIIMALISGAAFMIKDVFWDANPSKRVSESGMDLEALSSAASSQYTEKMLKYQADIQQETAEKYVREDLDKAIGDTDRSEKKEIATPEPVRVNNSRDRPDYRKPDRNARSNASIRLVQKRKTEVRSLIARSNGRFVEKRDGVVVDTQTGLMWTLLNSYQVLNGCLQYEMAVRYVNGLNTGGYTDWRLPTARELSEIYIRKPVYPKRGAEWLWTSEVFLKGWDKTAAIITPNDSEIIEKKFKDLSECGVVHPVRP